VTDIMDISELSY